MLRANPQRILNSSEREQSIAFEGDLWLSTNGKEPVHDDDKLLVHPEQSRAKHSCYFESIGVRERNLVHYLLGLIAHTIHLIVL